MVTTSRKRAPSDPDEPGEGGSGGPYDEPQADRDEPGLRGLRRAASKRKEERAMANEPETAVGTRKRAAATVKAGYEDEDYSVSFPLKAVRTGGKDKRDRPIEDVLWAVHDFKIYKTPQGVSPHFSDDPVVAEEQRERYLKLGSQLAALDHLIGRLPGGDGRRGSTNNRSYYEREMARGIAQALSGDEDAGRETMSHLTTVLEQKVGNVGRLYYFRMCFLVTAVVLLVGGLMLNLAPTGFDPGFAIAGMMGAVGALASVAVSLRGLSVDVGASAGLNFLYGGFRVFAGVIIALIVYLLLRSGIVTQLSATASDGAMDMVNVYKLAFIAAAAGFAERLVPDLLNRDQTPRPMRPIAPPHGLQPRDYR